MNKTTQRFCYARFGFWIGCCSWMLLAQLGAAYAQGPPAPIPPPAPPIERPQPAFPAADATAQDQPATKPSATPGVMAPPTTAPPAVNPEATPAAPPETQPTDQTSPAVNSEAAVSKMTAEELQQQVASVEKDETIDATVKEKVLQTYRTALTTLQKSVEDRAAISKIEAAVLQVPIETAELKTKLENFESDAQKAEQQLKIFEQSLANIEARLQKNSANFTFKPNEDVVFEDVAQELATAEANLQKIEKARQRFEQITTDRPILRKQLIEKQATLPARRKELQDLLAAPADPAVPALEAAATKALREVQLTALNAEEEFLKSELNRFDVEKNLRFNTQALELSILQFGLVRKKVESLQQLTNKIKRLETQMQLKDLKQQGDRNYPVLQSHVDEIKAYTEQMSNLLDETEQVQAELKSVEELLAGVSSNQADMEQKEKTTAGNSEAFALALLRQLYELPDVDRYRERININTLKMNEATFAQLELNAENRKLINSEKVIDEAIERVKRDVGTDDLGFLEEGIRTNLRKLIAQKREVIESLDSAYQDYIDTLTAVALAEVTIVETVDEYREFILQRIFWRRSDKIIGPAALAELFNASSYPISKDNFTQLVSVAIDDVQKNSLTYLFSLVLLIALILLRFQASRELVTLAEQARKANNAQILPTLRAIVLTLVITAPGPLSMWFFGWRLQTAGVASPFQIALSNSLLLVSGVFGMLEFFRQLCRKQGLIDAHFGGSAIVTSHLKQDFFLAISVLLPIFFSVTFLKELASEQSRLPLERVLFSFGMAVSALFAYRVFSPTSLMMRELFRLKQASAIANVRWLWYPVITFGPLILAIMAWLGYYYTASQLGWKLLLSLLLIGNILLLWALALRWYRIAQRWFRITMMRERIRQPLEESQTIDGQRLKLERDAQLKDQDREKQTLKLINYGMLVPLVIGLWIIWVDVLPAVTYLDTFVLWSTESYALKPLDLIVAILIATITIFLSRNMPGMLDFVLLQRIGIDVSLRYAFTSVIGYLITFVGISSAFGQLGFRWEQIQWLAAALTFGLSFGLQEIFANFISGLIILFERPVRIGDIVTIEGVTGVVTKIRIRASTITDWDRKEFLVPNKELVTGRVLNWTLSDSTTRIVIPVGIAYGSDTDAARKLLFEITKDDTEVLDDPPTLVTFEAFGDSTLNFVVRCYLSSLDNRLETIHRLHTVIHKRFMEQGIEIAFPQRDLHLRTVPANWVANTPQT